MEEEGESHKDNHIAASTLAASTLCDAQSGQENDLSVIFLAAFIQSV